MRLLEIVRGAATCPAAIATVLSLAKMLKKVPVVVRNAFGFVGNRMVVSYMNQAMFLVEEGAPPEQVDRVLYDFGMAMGPFAVADLSGLDVFWNIEQERVRRGVGGARAPLGLPMLVAMGSRRMIRRWWIWCRTRLAPRASASAPFPTTRSWTGAFTPW
jgi:3-hydroxyacyl-CoA dehydrogenase